VTLWRLEWLRLWRSYRLLALVVVFVLFGFAGPLLAAYLSDLLESAATADGFEIVVPDPVPADGIAQYVSNAGQIGLLVLVIVAALALATDAHPGQAAFYRTRVPSAAARLVPRFTATTAAAALAWTLGTMAAGYETWLLIGPLDLGAVVAGWALWIVYLAVAVAAVALAGAVVRSVAAATGLGLGLLLVMPLLGLLPALDGRLPSALVGAPEELARGTAQVSDYGVPLAVSVVAVVVLLAAAIRLGDRREL
jgi:ABC-2 type transport system permease protein